MGWSRSLLGLFSLDVIALQASASPSQGSDPSHRKTVTQTQPFHLWGAQDSGDDRLLVMGQSVINALFTCVTISFTN